jgi:hypothetical protein
VIAVIGRATDPGGGLSPVMAFMVKCPVLRPGPPGSTRPTVASAGTVIGEHEDAEILYARIEAAGRR